MKLVYVLSIASVFLFTGYESGRALGKGIITQGPCVQEDYDEIYKHIIQDALSDIDNPPMLVSHLKNQTIFRLSHLCHGQKSSYEQQNPLNGVGGGKQS